MQHTVSAGELAAILARLPADLPVVLQKDAEGNGYSPLSRFFEAWENDLMARTKLTYPQERAKLAIVGFWGILFALDGIRHWLVGFSPSLAVLVLIAYVYVLFWGPKHFARWATPEDQT